MPLPTTAAAAGGAGGDGANLLDLPPAGAACGASGASQASQIESLRTQLALAQKRLGVGSEYRQLSESYRAKVSGCRHPARGVKLRAPLSIGTPASPALPRT